MARTAQEQDEAKEKVKESNLWVAANFAAGREAMSAREAGHILGVAATARALAKEVGAVCAVLAEGGDLPAADAGEDALAGRAACLISAARLPLGHRPPPAPP